MWVVGINGFRISIEHECRLRFAMFRPSSVVYVPYYAIQLDMLEPNSFTKNFVMLTKCVYEMKFAFLTAVKQVFSQWEKALPLLRYFLLAKTLPNHINVPMAIWHKMRFLTGEPKSNDECFWTSAALNGMVWITFNIVAYSILFWQMYWLRTDAAYQLPEAYDIYTSVYICIKWVCIGVDNCLPIVHQALVSINAGTNGWINRHICRSYV